MPLYDIYCEKCGHEEIDVYLNMDDDNPICPLCRFEMKRATNCSHFKLKYNPKTDIVDWDGNRSRYWDEYNKMKDEGKKPRIPQLDGDG